MAKIFKKYFLAAVFTYCLLFSVLITITGFTTNQGSIIFQLIFLPVPIYFLMVFASKIKKGKVKTPKNEFIAHNSHDLNPKTSIDK